MHVVKLIVLGVLGLCDLPSAAAQTDGWSTSGRFHLTGSFTSESAWSFGSQDWAAFDAFERSRPSLPERDYVPFELQRGGSREAQLLDLIASAEAGPAGYDAVHYAATALPHRQPTALTIREIFDWIEATPGQHHAIGRYQFIPATLADLIQREQIGLGQQFSPALQDRLALVLLGDAGYGRFLAGDLEGSDFLDQLASIWAGLPLENGRSAYHGHAGNRATISREEAENAMRAIFGP